MKPASGQHPPPPTPPPRKPPWFRAPVLMYLTIVIIFALLALYVLHSVLALTPFQR